MSPDLNPGFDTTLLEEHLRLTPAERLRLGESLWAEALRLIGRQPRHFVRSFESFEEYETWRREQDDPALY